MTLFVLKENILMKLEINLAIAILFARRKLYARGINSFIF